jgi:ElaB/YqjD/DUF883 family membrane-anchored ribosome-binding protein
MGLLTHKHDSRTDTARAVDRVRDGADSLSADVKHIAHGTADAARAGVAEIRQGAHHAVESARNAVNETYQDARESAVRTAESVKAVVSRNPFTSIGIAAGVGILLGVVISRSRR